MEMDCLFVAANTKTGRLIRTTTSWRRFSETLSHSGKIFSSIPVAHQRYGEVIRHADAERD